MRDSAAIDAALTARLEGDAALKALAPDGVYFDVAPQGATQFVVLSLYEHADATVMGPPGQRRSSEDATYDIRAVALDTSGRDARQAALRIDDLLEDQPLTIAGFTCLEIYRVRRIRETAVDAVDQAMRWQHRGGRYRILAAPQYP